MKKAVNLFMIGTLATLATGMGAALAQRAIGRGQAGALRAAAAPMAPVPLPPGTRTDRDLAYGADPSQRLDVYRPAKITNAPIILMVHGGGWARGDKAADRVVDNKANHWLPKGFIFVSVNYRLSPQTDPLGQADDVAKALAFVQAHAKEWGGDAKRVVLIGHSAGAHLVVLLASAPELASAQGAKPWLGTIALDSAAYDVVQLMQQSHYALYDQVFGQNRALWEAASPTLRLKSAPAPLLLVCSTKRADSCPPTQQFAAKVQSLHGRATVLPLDLTHADINGLLGTPGDYTARADAFMASLGLD